MSPNKPRVTTPVVLQAHVSECGAACLGSVLGWYGRWVPLTELRQQCEVSRDGCTAASIARAAKHYGLESKGLSVGAKALKHLRLPAIVFWQFNHFVVLEGFENDKVYLNDPAIGRRVLTEEEFAKGFSVVALQFERGEDFEPGGQQPDILRQARSWLDGSWSALAGTFACGLMLALLTLLLPASVNVFVDRVLINRETWGVAAAGLLGGAGVLVYVLSLLKHRFLKRLSTKISISGSSRAFSRLLRLPTEFFNQRMVGDLTYRVTTVDRIARNLIEEFLALIIDVSACLVFLVAMLFHDFRLSLIVLALAVLNAMLMRFFRKMSAERSYTMRTEQGMLLGIGMQMLDSAENLRMVGADDRFFARWAGHQALEFDARKSYSELSLFNTALPGLIAVLAGAVILAFGAGRVLTGEITLGALAGFYILSAMFLAPIGRFVEFADKRHAIESDMQRLEDITKSAEDPVFTRRQPGTDSLSTFNEQLQLAGAVELRDVTFGYNKSQPPLIKDFNLVIKPGQRVAIIGPSGSGKSTLSHLVAGLHQPWAGEILFDGHPRHEIPEEVLQRSISMVDQDTALFSATLRDNITLWNPAIPDEAIIAAARDACIHDEILRRPLGYSTQVDEGGVNFSGGQRQRLEIARALVGDPTVLILDEASSALDAATEEFIDDALRRRGVTCLIVAHRLSTVRDCDEIIVLDKGIEAQRGTHDELIADKEGIYYKLLRAN